MSVFYFIGVYLLGIIFAGAWIDKVRKQTAHIQQMNAYRLLPSALTTPMFYLLLTVELACTGLLFVWNMSLVPAVGLTALLCIYTGAVTFNLLRGHRNISCGCGGLLENDHLHWGIVIRNMSMLALVIGLFYVHPHVETIPWTFHIICFLIAVAVFLMIAVGKTIMMFKRKWVNQFDSFIEGDQVK
ncbi:MauE/DoxX family redox-associated membrane protein [Bacillus pumilus]|uniref:MauE/DoxX family redox-associated membrane protein n=1 Tax=Bacillus pumilus TaxID=1408 RepID=UPI001B39DE41|nr:MauE/DoxX family redox-associated membrane protein [Bacillus pumilus]MBQ4814696.1 methylamine utilization protein [Bacillus pumilus]WIG31742.1 MauE/DoxX family redox-associated membrane protein [Bacillus pumilus]